MTRINKNALLIAVLLIGSIGFANCSSAPTKPANTTIVNTKPANTNTVATNTNTVAVNTNADNKTTDVVKTEPGDKIGVPECDEYIEKYEACINTKVPEAQREAFKPSFEAIRKGWKESASNPQTKATLAGGCKQAIETAKQSMSAFSCAW